MLRSRGISWLWITTIAFIMTIIAVLVVFPSPFNWISAIAIGGPLFAIVYGLYASKYKSKWVKLT
jgi:hypothetical protein